MELYENSNEDAFKKDFEEFLFTFIKLMSSSADTILREQGFLLKSLPGTIPDLIKIYNPVALR